ncbi:MAG: sigma-70 family RNA polymerase sigma factor [Sphingobacterium sp.]|jgi:RNA polymerase sigma-70 factor (ECF subfamily)|nr:sigma-70 family RNA polymerase sigma factor [Sphingobacterium sp.]
MTESILIENLRSDSQEGFVAIYNRFYTPLLYFITKYVKKPEVAEEILADVFVTVWNRRMDFQSMENLRAFLYISAKNASLNTLRSPNKVTYLESITAFEHLLIEDKDTFTQMTYVELLQSIFEEVERLPNRQKEVFKLTYLEDRTVEEIAQQLEMSPTAVYANRSRAISSLRLVLKSKNDMVLVAFAILISC